MTSFITSILVIITLMLLWVTIQRHWKQIFSDDVTDDDALAGRDRCGNCTCSGTCNIRKTQFESKH